jgi:hypothetical protein
MYLINLLDIVSILFWKLTEKNLEKLNGQDYRRRTPKGVFNLCQHFEISYSRNVNKHFITGVYITINETARVVVL